MYTVAEWFDSEHDPKWVGASEYRMIYDHVYDIIHEDDDPDTDLRVLIASSLDELIMYAQEMQERLEAETHPPSSPESDEPTPDPTPTPPEIGGMSLTDEIRENCAAFEDATTEDLDEMVHDMKSQEAADINNAGRDAQVGYLVGAGVHPNPE